MTSCYRCHRQLGVPWRAAALVLLVLVLVLLMAQSRVMGGWAEVVQLLSQRQEVVSLPPRKRWC